MRPNSSPSLNLLLILTLVASARGHAQSPAHESLIGARDSVPLSGALRIEARSFGAAVTIIDSTEIAASHARALSEFLTARVAGVSVLRSWTHDVYLSIAGLNLMTWTGYRGIDPEVTTGWFDDEVRTDLAKSPIPRTVVVRLDLR